jgi:hypothetical protein
MTVGTGKAVLVAVPLILAFVAEDHLPLLAGTFHSGETVWLISATEEDGGRGGGVCKTRSAEGGVGRGRPGG